MSRTVDLEEIRALMNELGMSLADAEQYHELVAGNVELAALVDQLPEVQPVVPTRDWSWPEPGDNPLGAWYVRTEINERDTGKLAGRKIAIKDNVLLAGVPLTNGTDVLKGYVPEEDAEIVRRILAEGGTIIGKTVCEAYCFSGGSHTASTGPVRNPHNTEHSAGGSSSGSGVVVANQEADLAIGCDQGGSVRMPASFCGIVGMKPTHSLVPYTGILGMNPEIDHAGPMTRSVADNALLLEVLAGTDGQDSRQVDVRTQDYSALLDAGVSDLRIGVLAEGFGTPASEVAVDESVREAAEKFSELGAEITQVSVPGHAMAGALTIATIQNVITSMFDMDGFLIERPDLVPEEYIRRQREWRKHSESLPPNVKTVLLTSKYLQNRYGKTWVARAKRKLRGLRIDYDRILADADAILLPTTPMKAPPLPGEDASIAEQVGAALSPLYNTAPFNQTHHPAISIPCGNVDGLPVGLMLIGRHFEESTLYRIANAFEQST